MAARPASNFLKLLVARGRDAAASLLVLLLAMEDRIRREIQAWSIEWRHTVGWGLAYAGMPWRSRPRPKASEERWGVS